MKHLFTILVIILFGGSIQFLYSQTGSNDFPGLPLNPNKSVLFGKDIVINGQPDQDQRRVAICSAFNGWLYAANSFQYGASKYAALTILKSIDNGLTWTVLAVGDITIPNTQFTCVELVTTGNSVSDLKLLLAVVYLGEPLTFPAGGGFIVRYNGVTGAPEEKIFEDGPIYEMSLGSDFLYPAIGSNPGSLGVLLSKYSDSADTLIFRSSSNDGLSLDNKQVIAISPQRFRNVSLSYGRSPSFPNGSYFACWEERNDLTSSYGRIYTSHTQPNFNSPFTNPIRIDNLDPNDSNLCRNPSIACQYNNVDNDSSNMTEVILFEKRML